MTHLAMHGIIEGMAVFGIPKLLIGRLATWGRGSVKAFEIMDVRFQSVKLWK